MNRDTHIAWHAGRRNFIKTLPALAAMTTMAGRTAQAADWPPRPVTVVVPYVAGGNSDVMARLMVNYISKKVGKPFIVENRGGGAGVPASMMTASATPDGCTVMFGPSAPFIITPVIERVQYSLESFTPINNFGIYPYVLGVKAALGIRNVAELIAYAKANPGKMNYSSAGVGSFSHVLTALFGVKAGIDVTHIPYKGAAPATLAVLAGEVDFFISGISDLASFFSRPDKVRIIATSAANRLSDFPQMETISETVPGYSVETWNGVVGPKGIPNDIVEKFAGLIRESANSPEVAAQLRKLNIRPVDSTSGEFAKAIMEDKKFYGEALLAAGIR